MNDDDAILTRLKKAIQFLKDNQSFRVGDLTLSSKSNTHLFVTGWTNYNHLENLTKAKALIELDEIKKLFAKMLSASKELTDFAQNKIIKYSLGYDYGNGGIGVCYEQDGKVFWETQLVD